MLTHKDDHPQQRDPVESIFNSTIIIVMMNSELRQPALWMHEKAVAPAVLVVVVVPFAVLLASSKQCP